MNGLRTAKSPTNDGSGRGRCARVRGARVLTGAAAARKNFSFAGLPVWRLTCLPQVCQGKRPGFERMQKVADDTTQHCHRLAPQDRRPRRRPEGPRSGWPIPPIRSDLVGKADKLLAATQPARPIPPPPPPAHAVAFTAAVAIGATGSSDRRATVASAVTCTGYRNRPGSAPATDSRQVPPPASPAIQARCFADHHPMVAHHPAWRWHAGADARRAVGGGRMGRTRAARWARHNTASTQTRPYSGPKKRTSGRCLCIAFHGLPYHGVTVPTLSIAETCRKWRCK